MAKEATRSFVLRVDASTMEAVERWAADEFRSTNGQLQWIIMEALRRSGRLKKSRVGKPGRNPKKSESMRISFMRWRPGSDGREPRERRKWLEINGVPSRARFRMFIRNRLWIGLPPAFVAGFGVVLLLLVSGGESTPGGAWCGRRSPAVYAYSVGYWASGLQRDPIRSRWPKTRNRLPGIGLLPASCDGGCGFFAVGLRYAMPSFLRVSDGSSKANVRCWRVRRKSSVKY